MFTKYVISHCFSSNLFTLHKFSRSRNKNYEHLFVFPLFQLSFEIESISLLSLYKYHTYLSEKKKKEKRRWKDENERWSKCFVSVHCLMHDGHVIARLIQCSSLRDVIKSVGPFLGLDRNANSRKSDRRKRRRDSKSAWTWQRASAFETESELNPYVLYALRKVCRQLGPIKPSLQFDSRGRHAWLSSLLSSFVKRTRVNMPFETIKGSLFHFELLRGTNHGLRDGDESLFVCRY